MSKRSQYKRVAFQPIGADAYVYRGNFTNVPQALLGTGIPVRQPLYMTFKAPPLVAGFDIKTSGFGIQSGAITLYPLIPR